MVQTVDMGYEVRVVVTCQKAVHESLLTELDHRFATASHEPGSKVVTLTEHVSVTDEADAVAFVRALVLEAVPPGSKITEITAVPG